MPEKFAQGGRGRILDLPPWSAPAKRSGDSGDGALARPCGRPITAGSNLVGWSWRTDGRKRKYYSIKKEGHQALKKKREQWTVISSVLEAQATTGLIALMPFPQRSVSQLQTLSTNNQKQIAAPRVGFRK
jgi:hypothetical protein